MNNGFSFRFNFETNDSDLPHELMPKIMQKVRALHKANPSFRAVELNLMRPGNGRKTACLTIHGHDAVIREEARDEEWSEAVDSVFRHLEHTHRDTIRL